MKYLTMQLFSRFRESRLSRLSLPSHFCVGLRLGTETENNVISILFFVRVDGK